MSEKPRIVDKIYDALLDEAQGEKEVSVTKGEAAACAATNMPVSLVRIWMGTMTTVGMIERDGKTIWLTKDYGKKPFRISTEEQEIIKDIYGPRKGKKVIEARQGKGAE